MSFLFPKRLSLIGMKFSYSNLQSPKNYFINNNFQLDPYPEKEIYREVRFIGEYALGYFYKNRLELFLGEKANLDRSYWGINSKWALSLNSNLFLHLAVDFIKEKRRNGPYFPIALNEYFNIKNKLTWEFDFENYIFIGYSYLQEDSTSSKRIFRKRYASDEVILGFESPLLNSGINLSSSISYIMENFDNHYLSYNLGLSWNF